ncbi:MAG: DUF1987 domain-containing protein [Bacteroidetes bacterium]|jgi:hypothetical protein|nr:DUF1987 domain-containing protein [Bacteroidota bacterium]
MKPFIFEGTEDTPKIILDKQENNFEISGKSLPEEVTAFYKPVLEWMDEYIQTPNKKTVLKLKFEYFNSASSKVIAEIIKLFVKLQERGYSIEIQWYYPEDDEEMLETGEEFSEIAGFDFKYVSYVVED